MNIKITRRQILVGFGLLERARKNGFQIFSYLEGGHDAMISQPNEIAEMFISMLK
jgi:predicted transcriptional regulator with HTH domain